jgi:ABC-type cobalamin/Fe3+-siderophores transport systems, ATPase components
MATSNDTPAVAAKGIGFFHGSRRILAGLDLTFMPGRHYVLAGPNGAGKSTFLDLVARLKKPALGKMEIMGKSVDRYGVDELSRLVSLAPQDGGMNFPFTIRETVAMGRRPHIGRWGVLTEKDWSVVDEMIARVHLASQAGQAVTTLSGGERRRAIVARALAQETQILLLDEPTAGLDVNQALSVMALARDLAQGGRTVITVSHDLHLAGMFADECIFLKEGVVAAAGPMREVFTADILSQVYDAEASVRDDEFSGGLTVSFRLH